MDYHVLGYNSNIMMTDTIGMDQSSDKNNTIHLIFCKHSDLSNLRGDITFHLCYSVNKLAKYAALGAQKFGPIWAVRIRTEESKSSLIVNGFITIENVHVDIYADDPYGGGIKGPTERVLIKDYPLWEPDSAITAFLKSNAHIVTNGVVHKSKARNIYTLATSSFLNGDRYFYAQSNCDPPIPQKVNIGSYACRVSYPSQHVKCQRCKLVSHKTEQTSKCPAYSEHQPDMLVFMNGVFSNFDRCDVMMEGLKFPTSEHCYQWMACKEALQNDVAEAVYKARGPADAKLLATKVKGHKWDAIKYSVMVEVQRAKAVSSTTFREALLATGDKLLVEGLRDTYWGSGMHYNQTLTTKPEFHPGTNKLGIILMDLRAEIRRELRTGSPNSQPLSATLDTSVITDECMISNPTAKPSSSNPAPAVASAIDTLDITSETPVTVGEITSDRPASPPQVSIIPPPVPPTPPPVLSTATSVVGDSSPASSTSPAIVANDSNEPDSHDPITRNIPPIPAKRHQRSRILARVGSSTRASSLPRSTKQCKNSTPLIRNFMCKTADDSLKRKRIASPEAADPKEPHLDSDSNDSVCSYESCVNQDISLPDVANIATDDTKGDVII